MKHLITIILALTALLATGRTYTPAEVPNVNVADRHRYVSDPDGILSATTRNVLDRALDSLRHRTTVEMAVAVVGDIPEDTDIDTWATELYEAWGLGKTDRDNGVLMVVARDARRAAIRTGYGTEGALPDVVASRILRQKMFPEFKRGNYDAGITAGVAQVVRILSHEDVADELHSSLPEAYESDSTDPFVIYLYCCAFLAVCMLVLLGVALLTLRGKSDYDKYVSLHRWRPAYLALTFIGLFMPLVASLPLLLLLWHWRNHSRKCPSCGTVMKKLDEASDNQYLTPAQDLEERLGTVDYDVWLCPRCHETDILPYVQNNSAYVECPHCHTRAARRTRTRIIKQPTATQQGLAATDYHCLHCGRDFSRPYKLGAEGGAAGAAIIGSGMGRGFGGGSFGGGSFGGGFGGGHTGGGGASGGW